MIEEIKTIVRGWCGDPNSLHWAQAKVYAFLLGRQVEVESVDVQLTYLNLDTDEIRLFRQAFSLLELEAFYDDLTKPYLSWLERLVAYHALRDAGIADARFPFAEPRRGQGRLIRVVGQALQTGGNVLAEAPTGIGKTVSVLYAAAKMCCRENAWSGTL